MYLLAFDYQGVFHTPNGTYQRELFDFIQTPPNNTRIAIISNLPRTTLLQELTNRRVSLKQIDVYAYEDMESKAAAVQELQQIWNPTQTFFVTDTIRDIEDVNRTNATILAVEWGFGSSRHLQAAHPHAMLCSAKKLIDFLHSYL